MELTLDQALKVKEWRVRLGLTWRKISEVASEEWPEKGIVSGHQMDGRILCDLAMKILGESSNDGW